MMVPIWWKKKISISTSGMYGLRSHFSTSPYNSGYLHLKIGKICCTSSISFLRVFLNGINPRQGKCLVLPLASYGPEYQDYITHIYEHVAIKNVRLKIGKLSTVYIRTNSEKYNMFLYISESGCQNKKAGLEN